MAVSNFSHFSIKDLENIIGNNIIGNNILGMQSIYDVTTLIRKINFFLLALILYISTKYLIMIPFSKKIMKFDKSNWSLSKPF